MRKFTEGTFELDSNVVDLVKYESDRDEFLEGVVEWATNNRIGILFGTSNDNRYMCEFNIEADTSAMCKGYVAELKAKLKKQFPKVRLVRQFNGNVLR